MSIESYLLEVEVWSIDLNTNISVQDLGAIAKFAKFEPFQLFRGASLLETNFLKPKRTFSVRRSKSAFFRYDPDRLSSLFTSSPLCVVIADWAVMQNSKQLQDHLIGVSTVDLNRLGNFNDLEKFSDGKVAVETAGESYDGNKNRLTSIFGGFPVLNLVGNCVGEINLRIHLNRLQSSVPVKVDSNHTLPSPEKAYQVPSNALQEIISQLERTAVTSAMVSSPADTLLCGQKSRQNRPFRSSIPVRPHTSMEEHQNADLGLSTRINSSRQYREVFSATEISHLGEEHNDLASMQPSAVCFTKNTNMEDRPEQVSSLPAKGRKVKTVSAPPQRQQKQLLLQGKRAHQSSRPGRDRSRRSRRQHRAAGQISPTKQALNMQRLAMPRSQPAPSGRLLPKNIGWLRSTPHYNGPPTCVMMPRSNHAHMLRVQHHLQDPRHQSNRSRPSTGRLRADCDLATRSIHPPTASLGDSSTPRETSFSSKSYPTGHSVGTNRQRAENAALLVEEKPSQAPTSGAESRANSSPGKELKGHRNARTCGRHTSGDAAQRYRLTSAQLDEIPGRPQRSAKSPQSSRVIAESGPTKQQGKTNLRFLAWKQVAAKEASSMFLTDSQVSGSRQRPASRGFVDEQGEWRQTVEEAEDESEESVEDEDTSQGSAPSKVLTGETNSYTTDYEEDFTSRGDPMPGLNEMQIYEADNRHRRLIADCGSPEDCPDDVCLDTDSFSSSTFVVSQQEATEELVSTAHDVASPPETVGRGKQMLHVTSPTHLNRWREIRHDACVHQTRDKAVNLSGPQHPLESAGVSVNNCSGLAASTDLVLTSSLSDLDIEEMRARNANDFIVGGADF